MDDIRVKNRRFDRLHKRHKHPSTGSKVKHHRHAHTPHPPLTHTHKHTHTHTPTHTQQPRLPTYSNDGRLTGKWRIVRDLKGNGPCLMEVPLRHLPAGTQKHRTGSRPAGLWHYRLGDVGWIHLPQNMTHLWATVNTTASSNTGSAMSWLAERQSGYTDGRCWLQK